MRETPAFGLACTQDAIREAGGIPPLVYLLQAGNDDDVLEATGTCLAQRSRSARLHTQPPQPHRLHSPLLRSRLRLPLLSPLPDSLPLPAFLLVQARWRSCA